MPCLIFYFVFLSGVQSTCTANPEQVSPSPLYDYLQIHLTTYPLASSSVSANCPSFQLWIQFVSPNGSPDHPNHFASKTSAPILSWMPCTISVYDPHAICFFFSLILLVSPIPLTLSRCSVMSAFGFCPNLFHPASLFIVAFPITFNDSQICHFLPNYLVSLPPPPLALCISIPPYLLESSHYFLHLAQTAFLLLSTRRQGEHSEYKNN